MVELPGSHRKDVQHILVASAYARVRSGLGARVNLQRVVQTLAEEGEAHFVTRGNSMTPRVHSGSHVRVVATSLDGVAKGDIALAKVHGRWFLHLVSAKRDGQAQISNNHGHVNGWTKNVVGKLVEVL